jgi:putative ABC transport system substrate-binding protein
MKRREFIALLSGVAATWPLAAHAQRPDRMRRVGILIGVASDAETKAWNARQIAAHATENRLPMIGFNPQAEADALMEHGVDLVDNFFRSASLVDKILKGTSPAELPIQRAVKFDFNINLKTAKALGIELPTSLLVRADHVIE